MDGDTLVEEVTESMQTELDRLGTSKSLLAQTDGDLDPDAVMEAAASTEKEAVETFKDWADNEQNPEARKVFKEVARLEQEHLEKIGRETEPGSSPLHMYLRGLTGTEERVAAGLIGRCLVSDATLKQTIGYFVGQSDTKRADLFRELRRENEDLLKEGVELLDEVCGDWESARSAAEEAVTKAYENYVESLEAIGVNPKPVC